MTDGGHTIAYNYLVMYNEFITSAQVMVTVEQDILNKNVGKVMC